MEGNPLRGLFGVSSPWPVEQRVDPQPTEPTENEYENENACFEVPSGMIEKLLANPFLGDGTKHPDEHQIYVDQVCGLFKLAGVPEMLLRRRSFRYLWGEMHRHGIGYVMIWGLGITNDWNWNFIRSFTLCILFIVIAITYIIFGLAKDKASLKLGGGLNQCYIHAPVMSSQEK